MVQINRTRYVVVNGDETEIFCGLARNYHFKSIENIGDTPIKTYVSEEKAKSSFLSSWRYSQKSDFDTGKYKVKKVVESVQEVTLL